MVGGRQLSKEIRKEETKKLGLKLGPRAVSAGCSMIVDLLLVNSTIESNKFSAALAGLWFEFPRVDERPAKRNSGGTKSFLREKLVQTKPVSKGRKRPGCVRRRRVFHTRGLAGRSVNSGCGCMA